MKLNGDLKNIHIFVREVKECRSFDTSFKVYEVIFVKY